MINAVKRKRGVNQRLPLNPEMLEKGKAMLDLETADGGEMWAVLLLGFHFAMMIGEIEKLEDRDISFDVIDGKHCVVVHIRESETDQIKLGVRRTLVATGCALCPFNGIAQ